MDEETHCYRTLELRERTKEEAIAECESASREHWWTSNLAEINDEHELNAIKFLLEEGLLLCMQLKMMFLF